jgi:hypothetical protein
MSRTRLGFIGSMAAYLGFAPKAPSDPVTPTGEISATGVSNYISGTVTISVVGGSIDGATPGGSAS